MEDISTQITQLKVGDLLVINDGANVGYIDCVYISKVYPYPMDVYVRWVFQKYHKGLELFLYEDLLENLTEHNWKIVKRKTNE